MGVSARPARTAHTDRDSIKVTFRDHKGNDIKTVEGNEGDDLLSLAHEYDVDLEGECCTPWEVSLCECGCGECNKRGWQRWRLACSDGIIGPHEAFFRLLPVKRRVRGR